MSRGSTNNLDRDSFIQGLNEWFNAEKHLNDEQRTDAFNRMLTAFDNKEVTDLDLEGLELSELPQEIVALTRLKTINLSFNNLTSIPLSLLAAGRTINVEGNKIGNAEVTRLENALSAIVDSNNTNRCILQIGEQQVGTASNTRYSAGDDSPSRPRGGVVRTVFNDLPTIQETSQVQEGTNATLVGAREIESVIPGRFNIGEVPRDEGAQKEQTEQNSVTENEVKIKNPNTVTHNLRAVVHQLYNLARGRGGQK